MLNEFFNFSAKLHYRLVLLSCVLFRLVTSQNFLGPPKTPLASESAATKHFPAGSKPVAAKKQGQAPGTATAGKERKKKPGKKPAPKATDMAQVPQDHIALWIQAPEVNHQLSSLSQISSRVEDDKLCMAFITPG